MSIALPEPDARAGDRHSGGSGRSTAAAPLDLGQVLVVLGRHWRLSRNVCFATVALVLSVLFILPPRYSSSAVVMLEPRKNNVTDQTSVLSDTPTDPASIQNQIQLLTSRDLAAQVVDKLGLANDPEFGGSSSSLPFPWIDTNGATGERRYDMVVSAFLKHLSVEALGLSTTISVTYSSRNPERAAQIANAVVDCYLEAEAAIKFDVTQRTTAWLLDRIRQLGQQVQIADANVERYKADNNLNDTPDGTSVVDEQLAAVNEQLVTARANLAAKAAQSDHVAALLKSGHASDVSQIVASPLIVQLREQQADAIREEAALAARYGPLHPKIVAAKSQMRDLDAKIDQEVDRIAGSVQNDVAVARAQVRSLEDSLQRIESQVTDDNMARVKLKSLEANAESTRSMYEAFVTRLRETQGQDILDSADARVISRAPIPNSPSWPPRLAFALASLPLGLLMGLLAALLAERQIAAQPRTIPMKPVAAAPGMSNTRLAAPLLADIPQSALPYVANLVVDHPTSPAAQMLRALVQRVAPASDPRRPKLVTLSSNGIGAGQTSLSIGLARAAAQLGLRTILVEGNLRSPAVEKFAGLSPAALGIAEILRGRAKLSQVLRKDPRSGVLILPVAQRYADPEAIWALPAMQQLLAHLRQVCDLVVIDAAPVSGQPHFVRLSDALILVGQRGEGLQMTIERLCALRPGAVGVVTTS